MGQVVDLALKDDLDLQDHQVQQAVVVVQAPLGTLVTEDSRVLQVPVDALEPQAEEAPPGNLGGPGSTGPPGPEGRSGRTGATGHTG